MMTNPKNPVTSALTDKGSATAEEVAALATRITALEQLLAQKIPGFEAVGGRVSELSTAFQSANQRLAGLESAVQELKDTPAPGGAEDIALLRSEVAAMSARVEAVEQTRARGGRLSNRLASIEAKLDQIVPGGGSQ
jgi:hypothetical protein